MKKETHSSSGEFKRGDGRDIEETRPIKAKVGVVPNADGSAMFSFGDTVAIAAVYGPKPLHPQHLQNPEKGVLRCNYSMLSFSVSERIRPGNSRRSQEISKVTEWALYPALLIDKYPNTVVDVHINILQANASTRCAGINAASLALAHAGVPMKCLVGAVSIGKNDKQLLVDVSKHEEDYKEGEGATDIPFAFTENGDAVSLLQLDGRITPGQLKEATKMAQKAAKKIIEIQRKALKDGMTNGK